MAYEVEVLQKPRGPSVPVYEGMDLHEPVMEEGGGFNWMCPGFIYYL